MITQIGIVVKASGTVSELFADEEIDPSQDFSDSLNFGRRQLQSVSNSSGFDLSKYITFELRRGDEDSADAEQLKFDVIIDDVSDDKMFFKMEFENPKMVSIGSKKDMVVGTIQNEDFFCSADSH